MSPMRSSSGSTPLSSSPSLKGRTGGDEGGTEGHQKYVARNVVSWHLRLDGGATVDDGTSSSASRDRFLPRAFAVPRFAADMFGLSGDLQVYQKKLV